MLLVIFGLAGAGKSYVSELLSTTFGFHHFDADSVLPETMRQTILDSQPVTEAMRSEFMQAIIAETKKLQTQYEKLVVSQTFLQEQFRQQFLTTFPNAQFILVTAPAELRQKRIVARPSFPLNLQYVEKMDALFEEPRLPHKTLTNDLEGEAALLEQLKNLLSNLPL